VQITAHTAHLRAHLDHGLLEWSSKRWIQASEGAVFLDALFREFPGSYVRAVEE
jgi:hypothetical protein